MPWHQEKKPKPKNVPFLNYIDVTRGYPSDKQDFFLVCLLFMGNNEFNLIWLLFGRRGWRQFTREEKKIEIDIPQDRQAVYSEMPKQDWTLHALKLFGSLFCASGPDKPSIMLRCRFISRLPFSSGKFRWKFLLSYQIRSCFFLCFIGPMLWCGYFSGERLWSEKLRKIIFHLINLDIKPTKGRRHHKNLLPEYFRLGDWFGIKFNRWMPQNDNKVTQNCYHLNWITLCRDSLRHSRRIISCWGRKDE